MLCCCALFEVARSVAPGRHTSYRPWGPPPRPWEAMALLERPVVHDEFMVRARPLQIDTLQIDTLKMDI